MVNFKELLGNNNQLQTCSLIQLRKVKFIVFV